jgi:hypothetical protein
MGAARLADAIRTVNLADAARRARSSQSQNEAARTRPLARTVYRTGIVASLVDIKAGPT